MNPNGILTTYEERMKANLQQYQRPEKAGTFRLRLDHRTWGKHMCLFCYFTDLDNRRENPSGLLARCRRALCAPQMHHRLCQGP